jgi:stage IV sporulation protein FB
VKRRIDGQILSLPVFSRNGIFFWCGRVLVRLRYTFILIALFLAASGRRSVVGALVWLVAATFGVLLHELGHAWMARHYGNQPVIELYTLGGVTSWVWTRGRRWTWEVACALAGPGISIVFGLLLSLALPFGPPSRALYWLYVLLDDVHWVTFGWSFFNLLPILPLDGAIALEAFMGHRWGADVARHRMRVTSLVIGLAVCVFGFATGMPWVGLLAGMYAYNSAQALRGMPGIRVSG